jgi:SAM-dependent methyltransferase
MSTIAADNWDQHWSELGAAADIGPTPKYRRRLIFRLLQVKHSDETVRMLEIGSGTGEFAQEFCKRHPKSRYLGLELSRTGVELSSRRVPGARFLQRDLLQQAGSTEGFDFQATYAICTEVLEHLDAPAVLLANAAKYMSPACRLIVTVPGGPMNAFYRHIGHRRHYQPAELRQLLETAGFRVERSLGAGFPFFNLFRLFLTWRGDKLLSSVSGRPSPLVRFASWLLNVLFYLNLPMWGWQTVAVARYGARHHVESGLCHAIARRGEGPDGRQ